MNIQETRNDSRLLLWRSINIGQKSGQLEKLKEAISTHLILKDLGRPKQYLNMEIYDRTPKSVEIRRATLINKLLDTYGIEHAKPVESIINRSPDINEQELSLTASGITKYGSVVGSIYI